MTRWAFWGLVLLAASAWAQVAAPVNPGFVRGTTRAMGANYGYAPSPVDWSHLRGGGFTRVIPPASYDLRTQGKLTAVRNQGSGGTCWAFASIGSLESCLLPGATCDFSENHLKNTSGFALDPNTGGGNRDMATAYLARWGGPVNETDDPYNPTTKTSPGGLSPRKHVQDVIFLPARAGSTDNTAIKTAVMTYGAVATMMFWDDACYNSTTCAYYDPNTASVNHMVDIVGWDDAYSKANFRTAPPANGAFIVRNSWGSAWGSGGYFYISYYDLATGGENTAFANAEATTNYTRIYQHDPLGATGFYGYGATSAWGANVFTAAATETLTAVSTYAASAGTTYTIDIYLGPTTSPISADHALTQSGTFTNAGYHTVTLSNPVEVTAGAKFSVVVKLTTPGYVYPIPVERPLGGYSVTTAGTGQSYLSGNGTSWTDMTSLLPNTNVCIKAFAGTGSGASTSPLTAVSLQASLASPQVTGTKVTLTATPTGSSSVEYKFETSTGGVWSTLRDYAATATADWTPQSAGAYILRVSARDTGHPDVVRTATLSYTITAPLSAVSLSANLASPQTVSKVVRLTAAATGGAGVQYQFSISSNGGSSWTVLQAYGSTSYVNWTLSTAGSYQLKVSAREGSSGTPVESSVLPYSVASAPPTAVALTAAPAGPQPAGTNITLTAVKTGGGDTVQYLFETSTGTTWTTVRAYNTSATATWTLATAGTFTVRVTAREPAIPATTVVKTLAYTVKPALTAVSFTTSLASPQPVQKSIRLTAAATGGAIVQYQFSTSKDGGTTWSVLKAYSTAATADWMPTATGSYQLKVQAREGSSGTPVSSAVTAYAIAPLPPSAVALVFSPVAPQVANTAITLTASKTGGTSVEYKFETSTNGATFTTLRDFGAGTTATWTPGSAGTWYLRVSAREASLPAVVVTKTYTYIITGPLTGVSLTASLASPQPINKAITLTATASGGANVQYQFSRSSDGGNTWTVMKAYSTTKTYSWVPTSPASYQVKVTAREGSSGAPVAPATLAYTITPAPPTAVALAFSPAAPQVVNTAVTLTASKTGGTSVQYKFEASANGTTFTLLRDFGAGTTATWTPGSAGSWTLRVSAREASLPAVVVTKLYYYTVTGPLTGVSLTASLASPQPINKAITLTATATGGASVQYQFSRSSDGGSTWTVLRAYSTTKTYSWTPTTPATYQLKVTAREGSSGAPVAPATLSYTITPAPPSAVSLTCAPLSPQVVNTAVTLTAGKTGGTNVEYKFETSTNGTTYATLRDFGAGNRVTWTPGSAGMWYLRVSARESTLPAVVVTKTATFTVTPVLSAVTLSTSLASPQLVKKTITLTATKTGGASVQYQFSASKDNGATWSTLRTYGASTTFSWIPSTAANYQLKASAREGSNGTPVEATKTFAITAVAQNSATWRPRVTASLAGTRAELTEVANDGSFALYDVPVPALPADLQLRTVVGSWAFAVRRPITASPADDIVLGWPDLGTVPAGTVLTLVDLATGERRFLRTTAMYAIPASRGVGEHPFLLVATREDNAPLHILNLRAAGATRGMGARLDFTLTGQAEARITIRALSGRVICHLAAVPSPTGLCSVLWDGHTDDGRMVPVGLYQAEILATDHEGRMMRALTTMSLR